MTRQYTRRPVEDTQRIRHVVQVALLLLNIWIGVQIYSWVRYFETGGGSAYVSRPPGVEGWLPIASLMNLKYFVMTGVLPEVHPAGMFLLIAFLTISVLFRKAFCSWLCPIGTLSEWLWRGGVDLFGKCWRLPRWADLPLRSLKYVLLLLFAWVVTRMSIQDLHAFLGSPYGLVADVKMLDILSNNCRTRRRRERLPVSGHETGLTAMPLVFAGGDAVTGAGDGDSGSGRWQARGAAE